MMGKLCCTAQLTIIKDLLVVSLGYFFLYLSIDSLCTLQSTVNAKDNLGKISQTLIYGTIAVSALLLPKLIIKKLGCKSTIIVCILASAPYFAANFYPRKVTFIPTAILLGLAGAPFWSAICTYINEISMSYSVLENDSEEVVTSRFFGIFFMFFQCSVTCGNFVSFFVLRPPYLYATSEDFSLQNKSHFYSMENILNGAKNFSCGADYCDGISENLLPPSEEKRYMLICVYLCNILLSALSVALFLSPLKQNETRLAEEDTFSHVIATFKQFRNTKQILLIPITLFIGIEEAFIFGDYSEAYIACAWGVHNIGLVFICFGIVSSIMSYLAGWLVKYIPRMVLVLAGAAANLGVSAVLFLWEPDSDESIYFFILIGFWGMSDAIWQTQINSLYGLLFRDKEEAAFANFKLWECAGLSLAFGYSSFLCTASKIYILLTFLTVGVTGYFIVEIQNSMHRKTYKISPT